MTCRAFIIYRASHLNSLDPYDINKELHNLKEKIAELEKRIQSASHAASGALYVANLGR